MTRALLAVLLTTVMIAASAAAQPPRQTLHPQVPRLDARGQELAAGESGTSAAATCGRCHDADYITRHSSHGKALPRMSAAAPDCFDCHTADAAGIRAGTSPLGAVRDPSNANCLACHGGEAVEHTGTVFSAERIARSGLNVRGKATLTRAFDVHAERLVRCVDCHHAANNPAHPALDDAAPTHLARDPRRAQVGAYLQRPDHRLAQASGQGDCTACHDATAGHDWLPERRHHMTALACQSCHVPQAYGPALRLIDWTLPDGEGRARREYRNVVAAAGGVPYVEPYAPALLPGDASVPQLRPVNPVLRWRWHSGDGVPVPQERVQAALMPDGVMHPLLHASLDTDGDGSLTPAERSLSSDRAVATAVELLVTAGVRAPRITADVVAEPVSHGVARGEWATRECSTCHSRTAAAFDAITVPGALPPGQSADDVVLPVGVVVTALSDGAVRLTPEPAARGAYLLGRTHVGWVNAVGLLAVLGVLLGASVHTLLRLRNRRGHAGRLEVRHRVQMYNSYERLWHWVQALTFIGLLLTGLAVHRPDLLGWLPFAVMVRVHNALGLLLLLNAALAAFYHFATGAVRRYLPQPRGFFSDAVTQLAFYTRGMFRGDPHPFHRTPERRLNPLQQVTYLAILNVLLPVQIVSGLLIWIGEALGATLPAGSLALLATVHTLTAWLFTAFLLMHIYLTTTGRTPLSHIRAMVDGWDEVESQPVHTDTSAREEAPLAGVI